MIMVVLVKEATGSQCNDMVGLFATLKDENDREKRTEL